MTDTEYRAQVEVLVEEYRKKKSNEAKRTLFDFQFEYMSNVLSNYEKTINGVPAKQVCYDLLAYAINDSETGNSIEFVETKELADEVNKIIMTELGEYLLDAPQIYKENNEWAIDCMFGGCYVPLWDGWEEK